MALTVLWIGHVAQIDGAGLTMTESVEALARAGHSSHVVLPSDGPLVARLNSAAGVHFCHHNQWVTSTRVGRVATARWLAYNRRVAEPALACLASAVRADVIVSNTGGVAAGGFAARRAGVPHMWFLHELYSARFGMRFLLGRPLTMWLMRSLADEILTVSAAVRDAFRPSLPAVDDAVAWAWAPTSDAEASYPPAPGETGPLRLLSVGSWIPGKALEDAIDAIALLSRDGLDVRLELLGGSETWHREALATRAARVGAQDRVTFTPFEDDPTRAYLRADAVLMCSAFEGLGRGAIEALRLGRPVVAARGGGLLDVVSNGQNGLLYRPDDPADLARQVRLLYEDRSLLRRLGETGRRDARERFTAERLARVLESALRRTTEAHLTGRSTIQRSSAAVLPRRGRDSSHNWRRP